MNNYFGDSVWSEQQELDEFMDWDGGLPNGRAPAMSLPAAQQAALGAAVEASLRDRGCDNTLRAAQLWAEDAAVDWPRLRVQLEGYGGYCDCEILLNVFPDVGEEPDRPPSPDGLAKSHR